MRVSRDNSSAEKTELQRRILLWYRKRGRMFPWRSERTRWGRDPYRVLVSEVMLQQTQAERVIPYYSRWTKRWPTIRHLARARRASVIKAWAGLGYNRRAVYLPQHQKAPDFSPGMNGIFGLSVRGFASDTREKPRALARGGSHEEARKVVSEYGGEFPYSEEELMKLPGVGRYTPRAIRVFAFGEDEGVLETNTKRIILRAFLGVSSLSELKFLLDQGEIVTSLVTQRSNQESVPHERSARISPRSSMSSNSVAVKARQTVDDFTEEFARLILASCVQRGGIKAVALRRFFSENDLLSVADAVVPRGKGDEWNQAMMDFGAMVCTARRPKCEECPLRKMCLWYRNRKQLSFAEATEGRVRRPRFEETDRYFRGRIVDAVRESSFTVNNLWDYMEARHGLSSRERFDRLVENLQRDGLIDVTPAPESPRLQSGDEWSFWAFGAGFRLG